MKKLLVTGLIVAALLAATVLVAARRGAGVVRRPGEAELAALVEAVRAEFHTTDRLVLPLLKKHADEIARLTGRSRVNGSEGLERVVGYVRSVLKGYKAAGLVEEVEEMTFPVTSPRDPGSRLNIDTGDGVRLAPAWGVLPNNCTFTPEEVRGPLRYVGEGRLDDIYATDLEGAIAVLEFASGDAWQECAKSGAVGAVFLGGEGETYFQADGKFLALLPVSFPRVYVEADRAEVVRRAAKAGNEAELFSGVRYEKVDAPVIEAVMPGEEEDGVITLCCHLDSFSITPGLAPGGDEVWGPAAVLASIEFFRLHPPRRPLRFLFFTGRYPDMAAPRQYVGRPLGDDEGLRFFDCIGVGSDGGEMGGGRDELAFFAADLSTEAASMTISNNGYPGLVDWQHSARDKWLELRLFPRKGWWYEAFCAASLPPGSAVPAGGEGDLPELPLYGNSRPHPYGGSTSIAPSRNTTPFVLAPEFYTTSEPFFASGGPGYEFQTAPLYRFRSLTPSDTYERSAAALSNLDVQVRMMLSTISRVAGLPAEEFNYRGLPHRASRGVGGYVELRGRVGVYSQDIVWYRFGVPRDAEGRPVGMTYVTAVPTVLPVEGKGVIPLIKSPWVVMHRYLQLFMNRYMVLLDEDGRFNLKAVYAKMGETRYHLWAFTIGDDGRLVYASDLGIHGHEMFPSMNRKIHSWSSQVNLSMFRCGSLALFDLFDPERYTFSRPVINEGYRQWGWPHHTRLTQDECETGVLPLREVREAVSQTDAEYYGFIQHGHTGMVFMRPGDENLILAGRPGRKFLALGNFRRELEGREAGGAVVPGVGLDGVEAAYGETKLLHEPLGKYLEELRALDGARMDRFGKLGVRSPMAEKHHEKSGGFQQQAQEADGIPAWAALARGWQAESRAYEALYRLKYDVVKTTVFYFILLIPFAFLAERLLFPQRSIGRTLSVWAVFFGVFALALWKFHPGFRLAENVFITIISFIIVLLTVPALVLLLSRAGSLLKSLAGRYAEAHYARQERAGMLMSALALSVSNMRRRRLRTGLTLGTITLLVLSLVLLTSFSAVEAVYTRPEEKDFMPPYEGVAVYNTYHHTHALLPEAVRLMEASYRDEALVLRREYLNYGFMEGSNTALVISPSEGLPDGWNELVEDLRERRKPVNFQEQGMDLQLHPGGLIVPTLQLVSPEEPELTGVDRAITAGRWFNEGDSHSIIVSGAAAERLELEVGDMVRFAGRDLELVGVFDSVVMDEVVDINGDPITPIKFTTSQETPDQPTHQPSVNIVFIPQEFNRREAGLLPTAVWALVFRPHQKNDIERIASEIAADYKNIDLYKSAEGEVTLISSHRSLSVKGGSFLAGPLLVTFFLILNIMLGTVYERTREINIFSSVGLSPRHVAGMFLAEALVYAGIASVLGYFIGVVLLYYFRIWGMLPEDFYPNYLGAVVIYATGLAVAATVLSTIYPMMVAARTVNPSLERSWRIPTEPEGARWEIPFPFIATSQSEALGIIDFLREFVEHHVGEPRGVFAAEADLELVQGECGEDSTEPLGFGFSFTAWLAPFERNLTEKVDFWALRDSARNRWNFVFRVERLSGPEYLWLRSNRHFVDAFRKQMLLWRGFPEHLVEEYQTHGQALFCALDPGASDAEAGDGEEAG